MANRTGVPSTGMLISACIAALVLQFALRAAVPGLHSMIYTGLSLAFGAIAGVLFGVATRWEEERQARRRALRDAVREAELDAIMRSAGDRNLVTDGDGEMILPVPDLVGTMIRDTPRWWDSLIIGTRMSDVRAAVAEVEAHTAQHRAMGATPPPFAAEIAGSVFCIGNRRGAVATFQDGRHAVMDTGTLAEPGWLWMLMPRTWYAAIVRCGGATMTIGVDLHMVRSLVRVMPQVHTRVEQLTGSLVRSLVLTPPSIVPAIGVQDAKPEAAPRAEEGAGRGAADWADPAAARAIDWE